jgi:hypothetical protein
MSNEIGTEISFQVSLAQTVGNRKIAIVSEAKRTFGPGNISTVTISPKFAVIQENASLYALSIPEGVRVTLEEAITQIPSLQVPLSERFDRLSFLNVVGDR